MKVKIEIWSPYPPPYGGVSVHSMRLYKKLKYKYNILFKNFSKSPYSSDLAVKYVKWPLFELIEYIFIPKKIVHLHYNIVYLWFIMLFYPRSTKIILTLHNQYTVQNLSFIKEIIVRLFFKKVNRIFVNDEAFANQLSLKYSLKDKIIINPAFIEPLPEEMELLPEEILEFRKNHKYIISSLAWKLYKMNDIDVYGIEHIVEAFSLVRKCNQNVGLLLLIPIIGDFSHYNKIIEIITLNRISDSVLIYNKSIKNGFDIWKLSDIFLRSTITDSEGISIKEALFFGTKVIATDIVERPQGVDLYKYGDVEGLKITIERNLNSIKSTLNNENLQQGIFQIDKIYKELTENMYEI